MSSKYQIWLTHNNEKEKLRLPVLPEKIETNVGSKNQSVDVAGLGEITIMQDRPAISFSFSSFFPSIKIPETGTLKLELPEDCINRLLKWKNSDKPTHLIITGTSINLFVSIEKLDYEERGGDVGSIYYVITLKEYRDVKIRQVTVKEEVAIVSKEEPRVDDRVQEKSYTVAKGDSLYNISAKQLGTPSKWQEIATINNIKAPYTIYPNQVLKLPS